MQRAEKAAKPTGGTSQRQPAAGRMAAPEAPSTVSDRRPDAIAQREPLPLIARSPRVDAGRALNESIHSSPRMVAQRQQLHAIFGGAVQLQGGLQDEEPVQGQLATAQRQTSDEEEEPLQGRFETAQRQEAEEEELQMKAAPAAPAQLETEFPAPPNRTGLPDGLKTGIESLSGMAMDHVRVHYNSSQPAQLNALAYAQGSDIHVAPGQERHLPHEAWHVVQQAQGRVRPRTQLKGVVPVNDDQALEREADVMGQEATAGAALAHRQDARPEPMPPQEGGPPVQRLMGYEEFRRGLGVRRLSAQVPLICGYLNQYRERSKRFDSHVARRESLMSVARYARSAMEQYQADADFIARLTTLMQQVQEELENLFEFPEGQHGPLDNQPDDLPKKFYERRKGEKSWSEIESVEDLFPNGGPKKEDITQGIGDCYLLASVAAVLAAIGPSPVSEMFTLKEGAVQGWSNPCEGRHGGGRPARVAVRLWRPVRLANDGVPVDTEYQEERIPVWVLPADKGVEEWSSPWVTAIERAYARWRGRDDFEKMVGGEAWTALAAILGSTAGQAKATKKKPSSAWSRRSTLFQKIEKRFGQGPVVIDTKSIRNRADIGNGQYLIGSHSYAVTALDANARTLQVYDPNNRTLSVTEAQINRYFVRVHSTKAP